MTDCCIVGAGIGGLTLAYRLKQAGLSCVVLEASSHAGGMVRSETENGFLLEHGPNSALGKRHFRSLCEELGLASAILEPQPEAKRRYLVVQQPDQTLELVAMPRSLWGILNSPVLTRRGKLRLIGDTFVSRAPSEDEDVASFMSRRVGREFTERIIAPLLGGIWAADISKLSCRSALPFAWNLELNHRSLAWGFLRERVFRSYAPREPRPTLLSFKDGMQSLPSALARQLTPDELQLNAPVEAILPESQGVRIHYRAQNLPRQFSARCVVLTTPAGTTASLLKPHASTLATEIAAIPYAPLGVLHLAVPADKIRNPLDGFGFLVPPSAKIPLLGVIFSSSLFAGRAPNGMHLLTCFAGGATKGELADVNNPLVRASLINEVQRLLGITAEPEVINATHYTRSIPNYAVGHHRLHAAVEKFEREARVIRVLANWKQGISVPDRIESAENLARNLIEQLRDDIAGQSQVVESFGDVERSSLRRAASGSASGK